jgi:predicted lipoprotein
MAALRKTNRIENIRNDRWGTAAGSDARMMHRRLATAILIAGISLVLSGCKVLPLGEDAPAAVPKFDAAAYAADLWATRALPHFTETAHPVAEVLPAIAAGLPGAGEAFGYRAGEGSPWSFVVSGTGTVTAKNTESRAGTLELTVDGVAGPVVLQIGPVIRGNAIRDALPFVSFQDFTNQLEYADVGKALTALAAAGFTGNAETVAAGDQVSFVGAVSLASASDKILVTPVSIEKVAP